MGKRCYGCMNIKTQYPLCEHCGYPDTARNEPHQLPLGTVLRGQYVIGKVLGQGGFGITYLGWDKNLEAPVAIKEYFPQGEVSRNTAMSTIVCTTGTASKFQEGRDRFIREARTLGKLRTLNSIVQVYNSFEDNGTAYIVMEYIRGITLLQYIQQRGGRLTPSETFTFLRPVIRALQQVHEAGMIHRDISPDNIMLQQDGSVKLLDFGTARDVDLRSDGQMTHSTQAVLKFGFAPAEQYSSGRAVDLRADEYALCATIYYCLTGRTPPDAMQRLMEGIPLAWNTIPGLTPAQIQALEAGTAIRPEQRFPNMLALENALFGTGYGQPYYQSAAQNGGAYGPGYQNSGNYGAPHYGYQNVSGSSQIKPGYQFKAGSRKKPWLIIGLLSLALVLLLASAVMLLTSRNKEATVKSGGGSPSASQFSNSNPNASLSGKASGDSQLGGTLEKPRVSKEIVWEDGDFTFRATLTDSFSKGEIPVEVENRSKHEVTFSSSQILINNFLPEDSSLYCVVPAGSSATETIRLNSDELESAKIDEVIGLGIQVRVYENEDYKTLAESEMLFLGTPVPEDHPFGELGKTFLTEHNGVEVWFIEYEASTYDPENFENGHLLFYLENNSDYPLTVYANDAQINGKDAPIAMYCELPAHSYTIDTVYLFGSDIYDVEDVDDIWMDLCFYDPTGLQETEYKDFTIPFN